MDQNTPINPVSAIDMAALRRKVAKVVMMAILILFLFFFIPAGTIKYWQAWAYMATLFIPALFMMAYLLRKDPELMQRRMKTKEKETEQKLLIRIGWLLFFPAFLIPGFDFRYGWSSVPTWCILLSDLLIISGYFLFARVLMANRYAARVVEVEEKQQLISTGPYAVVRHPMYSAILIIYIFSPLALGSYWAVIPMLFLIGIVVARILNEEAVLSRELEGYREYMQKTKYRIIPGIW
jgi:protein-S-isoprenylcysteine O-methyltransferase Ste14